MPCYRFPRRILKREPDGIRWEDPKKDGWMAGVRRRMTDDRTTQEDTRDKNTWGNLNPYINELFIVLTKFAQYYNTSTTTRYRTPLAR